MKNPFRRRSRSYQVWREFSQPKRRNMFQRMGTFEKIALPIFLFVAVELFSFPFCVDLAGTPGLLSALFGLSPWADGIVLISAIVLASTANSLTSIGVAGATLAFNFFRK